MHYLLLSFGIFFLIISILILSISGLNDFDTIAVLWMSLHRSTLFNQITQALSVMGGMPFVLLFTTLWCIYLVWYKKYTNIIFICIGILGGISLSWLFKFLYARPRPDAHLHLVESFGSSFPSAHSAYAACIAGLMLLIYQHHPQRSIIALCAVIWMSCMGISRVYLGVHFPSDVISGWSISFIWISALYLVLRKYSVEYK
ncbi:phosphatase PAP2 family protein [Acinetobacter wanghuae]|uniref:undecaprenyl-diphosphate phosphatase n=1 Tax=Acinetobacter wanghuae TaxID=2662362 RepID=A0A5Q0P4V3_9GAMM|nr:phosphatase PAP2 family protein [Acinetobacter wanghuae]MQW91468.1 phosphatase PAP2 family protein [Acinetobacter wanghuae]QGA11632.1 phosphatase PAP2 family protein [Acinetobacter wanghuae]